MKVRIEDLNDQMFISRGFIDAYYVQISFVDSFRTLRKDLTFTRSAGYDKKEHQHIWDAPGWFRTREEVQETIQKVQDQGFALVEI